jgi:hypothetical protein
MDKEINFETKRATKPDCGDGLEVGMRHEHQRRHKQNRYLWQ